MNQANYRVKMLQNFEDAGFGAYVKEKVPKDVRAMILAGKDSLLNKYTISKL